MTAGTLRARVAAALADAMRGTDRDTIALIADRAKVVGVALAGLPDDADVAERRLTVTTRSAASILGFHPEHVRRLIRTGRLVAVRSGGDYVVRVDDLWPLVEAKHRPPGRRRPSEVAGRGASVRAEASRDDRPMSEPAGPP